MFDSILAPQTLPKRQLAGGSALATVFFAAVIALGIWFSRQARGNGGDAIAEGLPVRIVAPVLASHPGPQTASTKPIPSRPRSRQARMPDLHAVRSTPQMLPEEIAPEAMAPSAAAELPPNGDQGMGGGTGLLAGDPEGSGSVRVPRRYEEGRMVRPVKISGPDPQYTANALDRRVEGLVVADCILTVEGRVHDCRIVRSRPFMDAAVIQALEGRRYTPAMLDGSPIEVIYTFRIDLRMVP